MKYLLICVMLTLAASCQLKKVSDDTMLVYVKAVSLYNEAKFTEAITLLDSAETEAEMRRFVPALLVAGKSYFFLNDFTRAESWFRRALKLQPHQKDASLFLARVLYRQGAADDAMNLIETLLADDPNDVRTLRLAAEIARVNEADGGAESLGFLNRAADASAESAFVLLERARRNWIYGKTETALNDISGAKALAGNGSALYRVIENLEKTIKQGGASETTDN